MSSSSSHPAWLQAGFFALRGFFKISIAKANKTRYNSK